MGKSKNAAAEGAAEIVGLRLGGRARTGVYYFQYPDGSISVNKRQVTEVTSGENAVPVRTRIHYDFDPVDANGMEVPPGDPRLEGFYVDAFASDGAVGDLNQTGPDDRDHGCTPVFASRGECTVTVRAYAMVNGQKVGEEITTAAVRIS